MDDIPNNRMHFGDVSQTRLMNDGTHRTSSFGLSIGPTGILPVTRCALSTPPAVRWDASIGNTNGYAVVGSVSMSDIIEGTSVSTTANCGSAAANAVGGGCFNCGDVGHRLADCPNSKDWVSLRRHSTKSNHSAYSNISCVSSTTFNV